ncbi:hypothetical protein BpHYR1_018069 [Brachionus plicatilis]|uniref:Uncharacterized protein n=1 Tax=Brachionus plicatilis TaxID=10195 RepID=A0A3M7S702_BRAPC|nr:hypothetical protein BpHYR1_018069 [Brachionus plicatilis]
MKITQMWSQVKRLPNSRTNLLHLDQTSLIDIKIFILVGCFEKFEISIPKPIEVRWNSELKTLRAICKIKVLNEGLNLLKDSHLNLSNTEIPKVAELANILEPFEFVSDLLQVIIRVK